MSRVLILGATGSLGRHVLRQAVGAGHEVTVFVRTRSKLPPEESGRVSVHTGDLSTLVPLGLIREQEALINCAGHVADGDAFVGLVDRLVTGVDSLPVEEQPVCWFMAGAALLDIGASRATRRRTTRRECDVLASRDQLRAIVPLGARLAAALSGADG